MRQVPQVGNLDSGEKADLLDRLDGNALTPKDCEIIRHLLETIEFIIEMVNQKNTQLKTLLKRILGIKSEKSKKIRDKLNSKNRSEEPTTAPPLETKSEDPTDNAGTSPNAPCEKPKGHGRIGADAYTGAKKMFIPMSDFKPGDKCTLCLKGKV